jgi:hypothetical protein
VQSSPRRKSHAELLDARSSTFGRPTRMGCAIFSSTMICTARNTRSSSPSANTMRER